MLQRTCAIIKPDAIRDKFIADILFEVVKNDMVISDLFMIQLTKNQARLFYAEHEGRPYFEPLIKFTASGPLAALVLEGDDVVDRWRKLIGTTNPKEADPGTLRAKFGRGTPDNALHGSDSLESAEREIALLQSFKTPFACRRNESDF